MVATSYLSSSARLYLSKYCQSYYLWYVASRGSVLRSGIRNIASDSGSIVDNGSSPEPIDLNLKSVPVHVAYELNKSGHQYLDVRTRDEFLAGHPSGAINICYMFRAGAGMSKNPEFLEEVSSQFGKDDKIILGCQSGRRSLMAAKDLQSAGFTSVTDIAGGYSAWKESGLPTEK